MNELDQPFVTEVNKRLTGRQWYHQRFDGSPLFLGMIGEAATRRETRKPSGTEAQWLLCFFEQDRADCFLDEADIQRGAHLVVRAADGRPSWSKSLMAQWLFDEQSFEAFFERMKQGNLESLSDTALVALFEEYRTRLTDRLTSSSIIDHFALGTDRDLADRLKVELGVAEAREFHHLFSIATAPVHQSFIVQAEIDLLQIVFTAQQRGMHDPAVQSAIQAHQQRYFWLNNNYVRALVIPVDEFMTEVERWLASGKDITQEIAQLQQTPKKHRAAKTQLFSEHSLSRELRTLIEISEDFTWWQDERKRATYLASHAGTLILTEMSRRRTVTVALLKYLVPSEVGEWFLTGKIAVDELMARRNKSVMLWEEDRVMVASGSVVDQIHEKILGMSTTSEVQDLRGLVANIGRAIGTAKVVMSSEDISKVEEGDVLVAVMTRPDYLPAMRRAAAIVTDEGGITSHAAIVSRELGVPCIIGTKVATKSFKDGDMVEVNANHNWVRILSAKL